jgi:putative flippase GtrA
VISTQGLRQQLRLVLHEGFRFLIVGGIGTVLTIAVAVALHDMGKYVAITIATFLATVFTFLGNRYWTFRHRQGQGARHESVMFFLLNGVGLVIYYGCIWIMQDLMGLEGRIWYTAALVVGTGLGTLFRFWSYRKWVWTAGHLPQATSAGFLHYPEPAMAGPMHAGPIRVASSSPAPLASRPPGRSTARHAAPRRAPDGWSSSRNRPGAHRRT